MPKFIERLLSILDALLTWVERAEHFWWVQIMSTLIISTLTGYWTWVKGRPSEEIALIVFAAITLVLVILNNIFPLLRKYRSPTLAITVFAPVFSQQKPSMYMFILNKSPHNRAFVETRLHIPLSNTKELQASSDWISVSDKTVPQEHSLQYGPQELGPQEAHTNLLTFTLPSLPYGSTPLFTEAYLHVIDYISGRSAKVKIPGKFPPE